MEEIVTRIGFDGSTSLLSIRLISDVSFVLEGIDTCLTAWMSLAVKEYRFHNFWCATVYIYVSFLASSIFNDKSMNITDLVFLNKSSLKVQDIFSQFSVNKPSPKNDFKSQSYLPELYVK